jgi:type I restriction enzyme M protein
VILLPENLFYNTTAPGIVIILNKNKQKARKGKIVLINATNEFKKGQPKNYLPDSAIAKIIKTFHSGEPVDNFCSVIESSECVTHDFNLSPSRHVTNVGSESEVSLVDLVKQLKQLKSEASKIDLELEPILNQLVTP